MSFIPVTRCYDRSGATTFLSTRGPSTSTSAGCARRSSAIRVILTGCRRSVVLGTALLPSPTSSEQERDASPTLSGLGAPSIRERLEQIRGELIPKSLAIRLALTYTGLTLIIMAALGWTLVGVIREFTVLQLRNDLIGETEIAADLVTPVLASSRAPQDIESVVGRAATNLRARVT